MRSFIRFKQFSAFVLKNQFSQKIIEEAFDENCQVDPYNVVNKSSIYINYITWKIIY